MSRTPFDLLVRYLHAYNLQSMYVCIYILSLLYRQTDIKTTKLDSSASSSSSSAPFQSWRTQPARVSLYYVYFPILYFIFSVWAYGPKYLGLTFQF